MRGVLIVEREVSLFAISALWAFAILGLVYVVSVLVFRKHKQLISIMNTFLLLLWTHYFIIAQRDYLFDEYPTAAYLMIALALLGYYIFIRDLKVFIDTKKSDRYSNNSQNEQ